ncbi:MAG: hypothetical protein AAGB12_10200 [Pseudomonadota bacterium]
MSYYIVILDDNTSSNGIWVELKHRIDIGKGFKVASDKPSVVCQSLNVQEIYKTVSSGLPISALGGLIAVPSY